MVINNMLEYLHPLKKFIIDKFNLIENEDKINLCLRTLFASDTPMSSGDAPFCAFTYYDGNQVIIFMVQIADVDGNWYIHKSIYANNFIEISSIEVNEEEILK